MKSRGRWNTHISTELVFLIFYHYLPVWRLLLHKNPKKFFLYTHLFLFQLNHIIHAKFIFQLFASFLISMFQESPVFTMFFLSFVPSKQFALTFKPIFLQSIESKPHREKMYLTARFLVRILFHGRSFHLWSFHIRYIVLGNTCYMLFAIILFALLQALRSLLTFLLNQYTLS